jgi:putative heme degradation protein
MRKFALIITLQLALAAGVLAAAFEVSDDDMRDIEDTFKSLDSNVTLKDKKAASEAQELVAYFQKVEGFYAQKPDTADASGWARETHAAAKRLEAAVNEGRFDAALEDVHQIQKTCKRCHDVYKQK